MTKNRSENKPTKRFPKKADHKKVGMAEQTSDETEGMLIVDKVVMTRGCIPANLQLATNEKFSQQALISRKVINLAVMGFTVEEIIEGLNLDIHFVKDQLTKFEYMITEFSRRLNATHNVIEDRDGLVDLWGKIAGSAQFDTRSRLEASRHLGKAFGVFEEGGALGRKRAEAQEIEQLLEMSPEELIRLRDGGEITAVDKSKTNPLGIAVKEPVKEVKEVEAVIVKKPDVKPEDSLTPSYSDNK